MMTAWQAVNMKLSIEHGWFCIRHWEDEYLLWTKKLDELPAKGFTLESIADELEKAINVRKAQKEASKG